MSERAPVVLSDGPLKGREMEAGASDTLFLPDPRKYRAGEPVPLHDTNPHVKKWVTLFGRRFYVWVPVEVPETRLAEYVASHLLSPLAMSLWRDGEEVPPNGRAEEKDGPGEGAGPQGRPSRAKEAPPAAGARPVAYSRHNAQRSGAGREAG